MSVPSAPISFVADTTVNAQPEDARFTFARFGDLSLCEPRPQFPRLGEVSFPGAGLGPFTDQVRPARRDLAGLQEAREQLMTTLAHHTHLQPYRKQSAMPNVHTTAVRTMAGHIGQIYIGTQIVWESKPKKTGEKAKAAADRRVAAKAAALFA